MVLQMVVRCGLLDGVNLEDPGSYNRCSLVFFGGSQILPMLYETVSAAVCNTAHGVIGSFICPAKRLNIVSLC
jgi:hypothetical protein